MRRAYLFGGMMGCALLALWSCGLDDSAVVQIDDNTDASTCSSSGALCTDASFDGGTTDSSIVDSGSDVVTIIDAGPCLASDLPTCDELACDTSHVCAPPVTAGWTVVNLISGARPACDPGYAPRDIVEITDAGAAACACSCAAGDTPSCMNDNVVLGSGNSTCTGSLSGNQMVGGCDSLSLTVAATSYQATVEPSTACGGLLDASIPNVDAGLGRECDLQSDAGAAALCEGHRSCVPKPSTGHICIAHAAPIACPSGFTLSYQSSVADSFNDSRSCPACGCAWNSDGCDTPVVTLHNAAACAAGGGDTTVSTSACAAVTGTFLSVGLTGVAGAASPSCNVVDGGVVDGGVAITNDEVVCCSN